jgi:nucleoside-diphosphate-sugar epimerase
MRILITGGSGFIGSNLIEYYNNKNYKLLNIDSKKPSDKFKELWAEVDIRDYALFEKIVVDFDPEFIIHLAARTDLDGKTPDDYSSNTLGTINLLKISDKLTNLKRVIFTSSMLVCRPGYIPTNDSDYNPSTVYGESKVEMEKIIRDYNPNYSWCIIRPTSIWGPGFGVPYRNFFDMIIKRRYVHFGKATTKTYGYIGNVIYQIENILNADKSIEKQVFYIGDYEPTNIKLWADEIANELGIKIPEIPLFLIKFAAYIGDFFKKFNIHFPMTTFRLINMTTKNVVNLENTKKLAPELPYSRIEGIRNTLYWMKSNK